MRYLFIEGSITAATAQKFLDLVNEVEASRDKEIIQIYLSTKGGEMVATELMLDVINERPTWFRIIAIGEIYSAGFIMFFMAKCDKALLPGTRGMMHLFRYHLSITTRKHGYDDEEKFILEHIKSDGDSQINWCKEIGLIDEEIKVIESSEDLFLTYHRMRNLLEDQRDTERGYFNCRN